MPYLLIVEKPSAAKNFAKALGGESGTFNGVSYRIQTLYGHMLEFVEPHEMVTGDLLQSKFKSWKPDSMPWDHDLMNWQKQPQIGKDRNGKPTSKADGIKAVKQASVGMDAIVIATDKDPSGEGQLIGWEVIQAIGWTGPVKRMYFIDESEKELQKGFKAIQDLPHFSQDGEYLKSDVRSRWDFLSMQLTRLSTDAAKMQGYGVVVRQGRLKSVMTKFVADQLKLVKAYKKQPFFEVKYKDDAGNMYTRKFDEDVDTFRFATKAEADKDMLSYGPSSVINDGTTRKETAPGKLLDLGGLAAILGTKGYKSKEILVTYQKMYEARIVSYPRTEDKIISQEQFKEMLPLVDDIAAVVSADVSLLTHRQPRSTHVKDGGAHGANRPGLVVPASLDSLSAYGASGPMIYDILAKNFLAMFGENYVYDSIKGHIEKYPAFTTTISVPVSVGFKAIFDADKETSDDDQNADIQGTALGTNASSIVSEGVNKKPPHPTHKWLEKQLSRYDVGTGATRVSTLSEVTNGKTALLTDTKGKLDLTSTGLISSVLLEGSKIADPTVTESLFKSMNDVGLLKLPQSAVLAMAIDVVRHDKDVFYLNAQNLKALVGEPDASIAIAPVKDKVSGVYIPTGETVSFSKEWFGCVFSDIQIASLLRGDTISISGINPKNGNAYTTEGLLAKQEYKGKPFWGFMRKQASDYTIQNAPFPKVWSQYVFTADDEVKLRAGSKININAVSTEGKPFNVDISFGLKEYKGSQMWGIEPHFKPKLEPEAYTIQNAPFKPEFSGVKLTDKQVAQLRTGAKIMVSPISKKTKKKYTCNLSLEIITAESGARYWGLKPHFS